MKVTVDDILHKPFLNRTHEERLRIVAEGKPRPTLNMASVVTVKNENVGGELRTYEFDLAMYYEVEWLTGCEKRHTFFCWPCLLFMPPSGLWNTFGISDLVYYFEVMPEHQQSSEHKEAMSKLKNMMMLLMQTKEKTDNIDVGQHNEMVRRNRAILKRMTDVVCNLLFKEQPFQERINGCQLDPNNVVKNLQFLRIYDVMNSNHIEDAIDLIQISPNIVNDLVDTISKGIKMAIAKEIPASTYVSMILSDHSKTAVNSQISIILRYIKVGKVCERFVGFVNLADGKSVSTVYEHISNVIKEYSLTERLLALAIDGGIVDVLELYHIMKTTHPYILIVPWYGHGFDYVLQQSLANISECRLFFKAINEMKFFFQKKSRRYQALNNFMQQFTCLNDTSWFAKSNFLQILHEYRKQFLQFFEAVVENSTMIWEPDDITKAMGFKVILEDFETVFLLEMFTTLFESTAKLSEVLKSSSPEKIFGLKEVNETMEHLIQMQIRNDSGFEEVWSKIQSTIDADSAGPALKKAKISYPEVPKHEKYLELFRSITNRVQQEIVNRFLKLGNMSFCQLLSYDESGNFLFSNNMIRVLMLTHGAFFEEEQIRNELLVLQTNLPVFTMKSVQDIYEFLSRTKLKNTFKYVYKLAELILTLPIQAPSENACPTKFKAVKNWSYIPEAAGSRSGDVCVPCVEVDFFQELKQSRFFHPEIAILFHELNNNAIGVLLNV